MSAKLNSAFAEALGSAHVLAELVLRDRKSRKIGVVSVLPGEGKTTVAFNLSMLFARTGNKTLLIDADLRSPDLSRQVAFNAELGIVDAVKESRRLEELVLHDPDSPLAVLPTVSNPPIPHPWSFLTSVAMQSVVAQAEKSFDVVVFDLSPIGPVVDATAFARQLDAIIFVVEWGATPQKLVQSILRSAALRERYIWFCSTRST